MECIIILVVVILELGLTGQLQRVVWSDCGHHEVRDEADKDTVVQQVEVEHGLTKLNRVLVSGDGAGDGPHLGPLVPHQSPAQRVREELSLLVSDHQLERVGGVHILVLIVILTHLLWWNKYRT